MERVANELRRQRPTLMFRHRQQVTKQEINDKLASVDPKLGQVLFVGNASIRPDGGIIEVEDKFKNLRVVSSIGVETSGVMTFRKSERE